MQITGTHFNYFQTCKRKSWLFANGINKSKLLTLSTMVNLFTRNLIHNARRDTRNWKLMVLNWISMTLITKLYTRLSVPTRLRKHTNGS